MSRAIRNVVKRRSKPYAIQRFDRDSGHYDDDDGIWVDDLEVKQKFQR
jgi:hypothetical protein